MKLNKIKDLLEERGISQMWLSKQLGKSVRSTFMYATTINRTGTRFSKFQEFSMWI